MITRKNDLIACIIILIVGLMCLWLAVNVCPPPPPSNPTPAATSTYIQYPDYRNITEVHP